MHSANTKNLAEPHIIQRKQNGKNMSNNCTRKKKKKKPWVEYLPME